MSDSCGTCGKPEDFPADSKSELRPYGPAGSFICFRCAFADEVSTERAKRAYMTLLDAAAAPTGVAVIGGNRGPDPFEANPASPGGI